MRFVSFRSCQICFQFELSSKIVCSSVLLGMHIERNIIAIAELQLCKAIFHVSAILSLFEIGESQKGSRAMLLRPEQRRRVKGHGVRQ